MWHGAGIDFADLRAYTPEDDVRHIDWNVTARLDEPYVRQYTEDRELTAWLVLDRSASMRFGAAGRGKESSPTELAVSLARLLAQGGNRVGAILYDNRAHQVIPPRTGRDQILRIARELMRPPAAAGPGATTDLAAMLRLAAATTARRRSLVFVISDFIGDPGWDRPLAMLAHRHEVVVIRVVDPAELELPDLGLILVEDAETGEQLLVDTSDPLLRGRLAAQVGAREDGAGRGDAPGRGRRPPDHHRPGPARRARRHGPPLRTEAPMTFLLPGRARRRRAGHRGRGRRLRRAAAPPHRRPGRGRLRRAGRRRAAAGRAAPPPAVRAAARRPADPAGRPGPPGGRRSPCPGSPGRWCSPSTSPTACPPTTWRRPGSAAAQAAATGFVEEQPDTVDIGVLVFGDQALLTQAPTDDHAAAIAAIDRLTAERRHLARAGHPGRARHHHRQAGQPAGRRRDRRHGRPRLLAVGDDRDLLRRPGHRRPGRRGRRRAGRRRRGAHPDRRGRHRRRAPPSRSTATSSRTALDEALLTTVAQTTGGAYHPAGDADALADTTKSIDLRLTTKKEPVELTAPFAGAALLLLPLGALLGIRWHGRIV